MKTVANKTTKPKMQKFTVRDFEREFPNDDACLEWLKNYLYPDGIHCKTCDRVTPHHKVKSRKSYSCDYCGHHVHPTADTIYHKSSTPLRLWFYAIFLMASTRCGIAAKQLERELGVTYKTAWRMFKQIRSMLAEENSNPLGGKVEIDETWVGGKPRYSGGDRRTHFKERKTAIIGAVERGGRVRTRIIEKADSKTLTAFTKETVELKSHVFTDEWNGYWALKYHYTHDTVNHAAKIMRIGEAHTNSIEGFWSLVKGGIKGVYRNVSPKYMQTYFWEYGFRYSHRSDETPMFKSFLKQVEKSTSN